MQFDMEISAEDRNKDGQSIKNRKIIWQSMRYEYKSLTIFFLMIAV